MKILKELLVEAMRKENTKVVYYVEHYPHHLGTMNAFIKLTLGELETLLSLLKRGDDDEFYDNVEIIEKRSKQKIYALGEALRENGTKIIKSLTSKGIWSSEWEEGSFAFSTKGFEAAKDAIRKIETKFVFDEDEENTYEAH